jgi:hypothetical protein
MNEKEHNAYMQKQVQDYINDPNTKVYINYTVETGKWLYAVIVDKSEDFWLEAFSTEEKAKEFIVKNNLKMIE